MTIDSATTSHLTLPAEWQCAGAVMMALPHPDTDWAPMLDEAIGCFKAMIEAIAPYAPIVLLVPSADYAREKIADLLERFPKALCPVVVPTNDTWTRDYGPITLADNGRPDRLLDFTFNGWGMKFAADCDNRANRRLMEKKLWQLPLQGEKRLVLEGGSIDSDGDGLLLTTSECLLSPNRNPWASRSEIESLLVEKFGLKKVLWIDHGYLAGDDTDSHVDTLARFAPGRVIVYVEALDPADEHYDQLAEMRRDIAALTDANGNHFNMMAIPLPDPIYHPDDGHRLPATYANYLVLDKAVIMPTYGQPRNDSLAAQILEIAYERPIVGVDCRALIKQHGSLHCSTMQIPLESIPL